MQIQKTTTEEPITHEQRADYTTWFRTVATQQYVAAFRASSGTGQTQTCLYMTIQIGDRGSGCHDEMPLSWLPAPQIFSGCQIDLLWVNVEFRR